MRLDDAKGLLHVICLHDLRHARTHHLLPHISGWNVDAGLVQKLRALLWKSLRKNSTRSPCLCLTGGSTCAATTSDTITSAISPHNCGISASSSCSTTPTGTSCFTKRRGTLLWQSLIKDLCGLPDAASLPCQFLPAVTVGTSCQPPKPVLSMWPETVGPCCQFDGLRGQLICQCFFSVVAAHG